MTTNQPVPLAWVGAEMLGHRDDFIADLTGVIRSQIPPLDNDTRMRGLLEASITENIIAAVHFIEHATPEEAVEAPTAALVYARSLAQRDVPLSALIRAYRIGHVRFLNNAMRFAVAADPERSAALIIELVNRAAIWIDRVCEQVSTAYEHERDRWVGSRSGLRQQWVNGLLTGSEIDVRRAEEILQYPLAGVHIAVEMWLDAEVETAAAVALFDEARALLIAGLGARSKALMVPTDEREARLWFSVPDTAPAAIDGLWTSLAGGPRVRLAVGEPESGLEGFRRSQRQAARARRISLAAGRRSPRVLSHRDIAHIALLSEDLEAAKCFVAAMLGALAVDDERSEWLRDTLRVFLANNRSYLQTAERMILHRNTIQYRIQQAMDRIGHSFEDPDTVFKLHFALELCRWLGPAVLSPPM